MEGRFRVTLLILCALSILCLFVAFTGTARSHDWYSGSRNPVTGSSCCGKADCVVIPPGDVRYDGGEIFFRYPLDGRLYSLPMDQVLPSRDWNSHGCVWGCTSEGGCRICFFAGGGT